MVTMKLLYLGLIFVSAVLLFLWIHTALPTSIRQLTPSSHPASENKLIPFSNITAMLNMMRTGILREENLYGLSHSLENRFQLGILPETSYDLPRILHFIWVGQPIKPKYVNSINRFSSHNPNYKVSSKAVKE